MRFTYILLFMISSNILFAQNHRWILDDSYIDLQFPGRGFYANFEDTTLAFELNTKYTQRFGFAGAFHIDQHDSLKLYTNGCKIYDDQYTMIPNGDSLNYPSLNWKLFCPQNSGYNMPQSHQFLEMGADSIFILHTYYDTFVNQLQYTLIDKRDRLGLRDTVLRKNVHIVDDSLSLEGFHSIRHANGRDWWVVAGERGPYSNAMHTVLVSPDTVQKMPVQHLGPLLPEYNWGQTVFSPDGKKLVRSNTFEDVRLYDFDRCTGLLSNPLHIPIIDDNDTALTVSTGAAFSPDSRYLYISFTFDMYQLDLEAADIPGSLTLIDTFNRFDDGFAYVSFGYLENGPDGRIYGTYVAGNQNYIHVFNHPDRPGKACDFRPHQFLIPPPARYSYWPHLPKYRLGPIDGSPCDTLGINNLPRAGFTYERMDSLRIDFTDYSWFEPDTWSWNFGDGSSIVTDRHVVHQYQSPGSYEVCLTVSNPYGTDTKCKDVYIDQISSTWTAPPTVLQWHIWPNPADQELYFNVTEGNIDGIRIIDMYGRMNIHRELRGTLGELSLSGLAPGIYFVQAVAGGQVVGVQKLVKM